MAKIKIKDLPKNMRISDEEMKKVAGGYGSTQQLGATQLQWYNAFRNVLQGAAMRRLQM